MLQSNVGWPSPLEWRLAEEASSNMHATQQRILEVLQEQGRGAAQELSEWLDIKPPSLRYHLLALEENQFIERLSLPSSGDVGRPAVQYALTPTGIQAVQHCTPWLVESLLNQMRSQISQDEVTIFFQDMGMKMAQDFEPEDLADMPLKERLQRASRTLSARGYGAAVAIVESEGGAATVLQTRNCPYGDLPQEHRELCQMDLALVSELVGQPCSHDQILAHGDDCCTFHLAGPAITNIELA